MYLDIPINTNNIYEINVTEIYNHCGKYSRVTYGFDRDMIASGNYGIVKDKSAIVDKFKDQITYGVDAYFQFNCKKGTSFALIEVLHITGQFNIKIDIFDSNFLGKA